MTSGSRLRPAAGYIGLGIVLYLLLLIATAPAMWLAQAALRVSGGALTLTRSTGTLWRGAAELHVGTPVSGVRDLGHFQWRVSPWWLVVGRAQFAAQLDGPSAQAKAAVGLTRHRVELEDVEATFPASFVSLVYGPAAFFEPTGTIELRSPKIELSPRGLVAEIAAQWRGAGGRFTGRAQLGDYRINISGKGPTATIRLATLRGDLELTGQGQWHVTGDGTVRFTGTAAPKGDAEQLEPLLRALGRDLGGGRRLIRFSSRIPLVQQLGL